MSPQVDLPFIDEELTLTRTGVWLSNGTPVEHERTAEAFFRGIRRNPDGKGYFIAVGREKKDVTVEEFAFFVKDYEEVDSNLILKLSDHSEEKVAISQVRLLDDQTVICTIERHGFKEQARFLRYPHLRFISDHCVAT